MATAMATPGPVRVLGWHLAVFRRMWTASLLSSFAQPMLYLLGLGVGVGSLVDQHASSTDALGGQSYVAFVAPGLLITTAMALAAGESMWPVMGGLKWHRGYHGIAATPLGARDIVLGHALWIALRGLLAAGAVCVVLEIFPQTRSWGLPVAVVVAALVGVSFAMPIMAFAINSETDGAFAAINRFVIIPLFLFGGAFYPLSNLPGPIQWMARVAPLWHGITVARMFTGGDVDWPAVAGHIAYISLFVVVGAVVAVRRMHRKLYA